MATDLGRGYWTVVRDLINRLVESERDPIDRAASLIAERMVGGGRVYVYDTGHMLERELIHRAGGFVGWAPLDFALHLQHTIMHESVSRPPDPSDDAAPGFISYVLDAAGISASDVLLLASVTGARKVPVELALQAKRRGIPVVGLTSRTYSEAVPAQHSSGRKLMDLADIVINNDCAIGDAVLDIPGLEERVGPTSGVSASVLMWILCGEVAALTAAANAPAAVIESMNLPGAMARNRDKAERFLDAHGRSHH